MATSVDRAYKAMDSAREGIALLDEAGEFIYVNDAYTAIVGYDQDELLGEFWELVYPDDQTDRIYEEIFPMVPEDGYWSGDTVYGRKHGTRVVVNHALAYSEAGTMIRLLREFTDDELQELTLKEGLLDRLLDEAKTSGSVSHEGPRVRKDGSTFDASVVITAVYDETGSHRGYGKVTRDFTGTPRQRNDDG